MRHIASLGPLPFSSAVRIAGLTFVSGQASVDEQGQIVHDSFEGELRRSMANLQRVLSACGLGLDDVVQVRAYVGSPDDMEAYNDLYRQYFTPPYPARTTLASCIGDLKFEIDVIARDALPRRTHVATGNRQSAPSPLT